MFKRRYSQIRSLILVAIFLFMSFQPQGAAYAATSMTLQPITWNVIGLDSNDVTDGPEDFPVGVRACNPDLTFTFTDVEADFVWLAGGTQTDDTYIRLRPGSLDPIQPNPQVDLAPGECHDFYFEVELERDAAAYDQTRRYQIDVTYFDTELGSTQTVSTPTPREIYVEHLVSQNRNSVTDVQLADHTTDCSTASYSSVPIGGTMLLYSGSSYCIKMVGSTATNGYEQIETFTNFPNNIFLINSVDMTYTAHTGSDPDYLTKLYSDACTWNNDPTDVTAPAYRECISTGKDGGDITVTYDITIIALSGSGSLNSLIYDFSGSSYHYNSDFNPPDAVIRNYIILDPNSCTQETIAAWDFESSLSSPSIDNAAGTPSITTGGISAAGTYNSGNPGIGLAHSGWPTGALSTSDYIQFNVSTEGYSDINFSYDINRSSQGPANVTPAYDNDGSGAATLLTAHNLPSQNTWASHSEDLSAITSMDNTPGTRFVLYGHNAGNNSGDLRFDNVEINGCKLPAALNLAKSASPTTFTTEGQTITYTYTLINAGEVDLYAPYTITDDKVAGVDIDCSLATSPLVPGASTTCTGTYITTAADVAAGLISNNATANAISVTGESVDSNIATRTIYLAAMNLVKSLDSNADEDGSGDVSVGDTLTYRFVVTNTGTADLTGVSISDPLPGLSTLSCTPAQPATLASGETLDCTATYVVTGADVTAGVINNTATASSDQTPDDTDGETVNIGENPDISVTKEFDANNGILFISPTMIRMTYVITVENTGNVPLSNVQVVDNLVTAFTSPATFTLQGTPTCVNLTCNASFNGDTDTNLLSGSDTLPVGAVGTISFTVDVDTGGKAENYTNIAEGSGISPGETRVEDIGSISGPDFADPALTKAVNPANASIGDLVTFTIVVYNNGTQVAPNVLVTDTLPDNLDHVSSTSNPRGTVSFTPPRTVVVDLGDLGVDEVITITIVAQVNDFGQPPVENSASLTTESTSDQPSNNADTAVLQIAAEPSQSLLPSTGFAPSVVTALPEQTVDQAYADLGPVWLEIPNLGVKTSIVGIPRTDGNWNVDWLWQQAGWLQGTAFPTWTGNSVVTGHVYLPNGLPGPFVNLGKLRWGNQIIVHMYGERYIYEVRTNHIVMPNNTSVLKHEDRAWLTLITCKGYDETKDLYKYRIATRAVLMRVEAEP